ncbi:MAG: hypothetical protein IPK98_08310 [Chloracidobacterium sp.]|nr:hypothetical protein [Chloracidobacterium sp.]
MFCPKCGKADQSAETYCRQCGTFLPDLSKPAKRESPPEENIKVNTVLSMMTVIVSFTLAILLYIVLGFRETTHPLIYATAGLLLAMGGWHIQTFIRARRLKRQWKRRVGQTENEPGVIGSVTSGKQLETPDFENMVPASVTDRTTKHLSEKPSSSQS